MEQQEILEGNKLIAEFMGKPKPIPPNSTTPRYAIDGKTYLLYQLEFHSSWDWLMPVVEKIQQIASVKMNENQVWEIWYNEEEHISIGGFENIQNCFRACCYFAKWYNQQTKQP